MTSKALDHLKAYPAESLDETTLRYTYDLALTALVDNNQTRQVLTAGQAVENWDPVFVEEDLENVHALLLVLLDRQRRVNDMRAGWLLADALKTTETTT
jgi:hypothetical protein